MISSYIYQPISTVALTKLSQLYHLPKDWFVQKSNLFSPFIVILPQKTVTTMAATIAAVTTIAQNSGFQSYVLENMPQVAHKNPSNPGVLLSYDFHLTAEGPQLIEINTNASGAYLIPFLEQLHGSSQPLAYWESCCMKMFLAEWQVHWPDKCLKHIAIIDTVPKTQYFYPEFLLFQHLFQKHAIKTTISDPKAFYFHTNQLWLNDVPIEFIYNRLTDFYLTNSDHHLLQQAYLNNQVVLTPHPHAHALYARKTNLIALADGLLLEKWDIDSQYIDLLQRVVPKTQHLHPNNAADLWQNRKSLFFKPIASYGSKGVYRGKSITKHVFQTLLNHNYIAQTWIPPSTLEWNDSTFKIDIRAYVYKDNILGLAARLYQGQVTNFRTPNSGYAAVQIQ